MAQKKAVQTKKQTGKKKTTAVKKDLQKKEVKAVKADAVKVSEKKVVKVPEESVHIPVKTPINVYKGLFWFAVCVIWGMLGCAAYIYSEYQVVPRSAVVMNVIKGEKPVVEPAEKGTVKKARVLSQEEMRQILEEMRKAAELRKIKEKRAARRAQKASGAKTGMKPVETPAK